MSIKYILCEGEVFVLATTKLNFTLLRFQAVFWIVDSSLVSFNLKRNKLATDLSYLKQKTYSPDLVVIKQN